jgi:Holliday junction resolvase-like predicted endonuclease
MDAPARRASILALVRRSFARIDRLAPAALARFAPRFFLALDCDDDALCGLAGERVAARALARAGLVVRARRLVTTEAEIDLLCRDGDYHVLVEVKTGSTGTHFRPLDRVGREREERLARAARWVARHTRTPARVDYVEVLRGLGEAPRVFHYRARERDG